MVTKEIKSISIKSALKVLPVIYGLLGLLVGIGSFVYLKINPAAVAPRINFLEWLAAIASYAALFDVIFLIISICGIFLYNFFSLTKLGGIKISMSDNN